MGVAEVLAAVRELLDLGSPGAETPPTRQIILGQVGEIIEHMA
jgi:hypothetical protein